MYASTNPDIAITRLLRTARARDESTDSEFIKAVYQQLRLLAHQRLQGYQSGQTLCTTMLVNETYLRLFGSRTTNWQDRQHFFACAAMAMRQLVIDFARRKKADKRSAEVSMPSITLDVEDTSILHSEEILELDLALERLGELDQFLVKVVELRYFGGLTLQEIAQLQDCSLRTISRAWRKARAFLGSQTSL